jgi:hypothetical protein
MGYREPPAGVSVRRRARHASAPAGAGGAPSCRERPLRGSRGGGGPGREAGARPTRGPCLPFAQVREGLYYNPYFPGGAIAMPKMLADGGVEYDDGTPSSASQQAKVRVCARARRAAGAATAGAPARSARQPLACSRLATPNPPQPASPLPRPHPRRT